MQSSFDSAVEATSELYGGIGNWAIWRRLCRRLTVTVYRYLGGWGNFGKSTQLLALGSRIRTDDDIYSAG
jgi:hypothetical protein